MNVGFSTSPYHYNFAEVRNPTAYLYSHCFYMIRQAPLHPGIFLSLFRIQFFCNNFVLLALSLSGFFSVTHTFRLFLGYRFLVLCKYFEVLSSMSLPGPFTVSHVLSPFNAQPLCLNVAPLSSSPLSGPFTVWQV
jgi:hypothetical protein